MKDKLTEEETTPDTSPEQETEEQETEQESAGAENTDSTTEENTNTSDEDVEIDDSPLDEQEDELKKANDKYLRLHAEFENYRRRTAKESIDLIANANQSLISKLCDVLDNFERAFVEENKAPDLETFEKGMTMIKDQFLGLLEDAGLESINPEGEEFNPQEHEAMMQQPSEDVDENCVLTVFQKGYKLNEKVIRHAKVIVSAGKA